MAGRLLLGVHKGKVSIGVKVGLNRLWTVDASPDEAERFADAVREKADLARVQDGRRRQSWRERIVQWWRTL